MNSIAFFISPHGFGHAARACAVMEAMRERNVAISFEIFTKVPEWFFKSSLRSGYTYHKTLTDIGLVQPSPLHEDLSATLKALHEFAPFEQQEINRLAAAAEKQGSSIVVCDISPLGIEVARAAQLPSVLVENFTWDWIYEAYVDQAPGFRPFIDYFRGIFDAAGHHIQIRPVCWPKPADLVAEPVSRKKKTSAATIRSSIGIPPDARMGLISMGGIQQRDFSFLDRIGNARGIQFVVPGTSSNYRRHGPNVILLPHHSDFYHPDLIHAADVVIGKLGYGTVAEAYYAGIPYVYIVRPGFRESAHLAAFIEREMKGVAVTEQVFQSGEWINDAERLSHLERAERAGPSGSEQIARFLMELLTREFYEKDRRNR